MRAFLLCLLSVSFVVVVFVFFCLNELHVKAFMLVLVIFVAIVIIQFFVIYMHGTFTLSKSKQTK